MTTRHELSWLKGYSTLKQDGFQTPTSRQVIVLIVLSILASLLLLGYGLADLLNNLRVQSFTSILSALLLLLNVSDALIRGKLKQNILVGVIGISILFSLLYWRGFSESIYFIWYLAFPGFAAFTLGLKKGAVGISIMLLPIFIGHFFGGHVPFITGYSLPFELRFLGAYLVMSYQALLFQAYVERSMKDISESNKALEMEVSKRTESLNQKILLLDQEVSTRIETEQKMAQALSENEILFKEVHHRTKNNMHVIVSLLNLQKNELSVDRVKGVFQQMSDRIHSMALVHERLYQSEDLTTIDFSRYVADLSWHLRQQYAPREITIQNNFDDEEIEVDLNIGVPLGLVINEIITNSIKHAETANDPLKLEINLSSAESGWLQLTIRDNGQGLPTDFDIEQAESLGLHLIHLLIEGQLDGSVRVLDGPGAEFLIKVPLEF